MTVAEFAFAIKPMSELANDDQHFNECHKRWIERVNHPIHRPGAPDEWFEKQCMFCTFYLLLPGKFAADWGVCSNAKSPFDGKVAFEHDGCDFFAFNKDY